MSYNKDIWISEAAFVKASADKIELAIGRGWAARKP